MKPHFQEEDSVMFYKYLDKSRVYFEFGSGGSTYQASKRDNIEKIYSVESDKTWHYKLRDILKDSTNINYIYNEMDTQVNNWGYPGPNVTTQQKINYSSHIENISIEDSKKIDLVLIDGRFRVACCLKCFNIISNDCVIAFDDFFNRKWYHVVLDYYDVIESTHKQIMAILKKKQNITLPSERLKELIKKYELDAE